MDKNRRRGLSIFADMSAKEEAAEETAQEEEKKLKAGYVRMDENYAQTTETDRYLLELLKQKSMGKAKEEMAPQLKFKTQLPQDPLLPTAESLAKALLAEPYEKARMVQATATAQLQACRAHPVGEIVDQR